MRPDGTEAYTLMPRGSSNPHHPDWAPDGGRLAYTTDEADGTSDIWIADRDGANQRRLVDCQAPCVYADDPAWSPDGTKIAYWTNDDDRSSSTQVIRVADVATGAIVVEIRAADLEGPVAPRWSPDGLRLAVEIGRYAAEADSFREVASAIGLIDLTEAEPRIRDIPTPDLLFPGYPDWSPAGDRIVFEAGNADIYAHVGTPPNLYTVRPDGTELTQITDRGPDEPWIWLPTWTTLDSYPILVTLNDGSNLTLAKLSEDGRDLLDLVDEDGNAISGAHTRFTAGGAVPTIDSAGALKIHISPGADWLAIADGSVWTAAGRGIVQLDPITGDLGPTTEILGICLGFDVGFDSLWVGACDDPAIWRIDPLAGAVLATIPLPVDGIQEEGSVAAGEGGVWVVSTANELIEVDPATNQVVGNWPLPAGAAAVRAGLGSLWVTISTADQVLRIDPADPTSQTPIDVGAYPRFLAVGEDAVWVMNQRDGSVTRVGADGSVVTTIKVSAPIQGGDIAVGGGSVWVQPGGDLLIRIDPATNEVIATYGPRSGSGSVAADDRAVWVSAHDVEAIWRLPLP